MRTIIAVFALAALAAPLQSQTAGSPGRTTRAPLPLTRPERTAYRETSSYADVQAFLAALPRSPLIHLTTMGYSGEGRALPLVVVGRVRDASADAVKASGKLRVYIQANIHAGEVEGKEAAQILLRDIASGRHGRWPDSLVLLVAPIYNADGNERVSLTSRPLQLGPIGGQGQRANAAGLDLNRDHMKLESSEARAQALLLRNYDPHVAFDLHTTDGSVHGYHLTYAEPLHPATDTGIVNLLRRDWLPAVTQQILQSDDMAMYFYGNMGGPEGGQGNRDQGWSTFDYRPRFSENYWGIRNRIGILSEAYSYATFEDRIKATRRFVEEGLDYAYAHATRLRRLTEAADAHALVGESLAVRAQLHRGPDAPILRGGVTDEVNPNTGQRMLHRTAERRPEPMPDLTTFEATEYALVPRAYYVPAGLRAVLERLAAHGVRTTTLDQPLAVATQRFRIDSTWTAGREFQGHRERQVRGAWEAVQDTLPAGTVAVALDQPLGRLVVLLLDPRSDDGLLDWNLMDTAIEGQRYYPVRRALP